MEHFFGAFHSLPSELHQSIMIAAKCSASKMDQLHDIALANQKAAQLRKEEIAHKKLTPHKMYTLWQLNFGINITHQYVGPLSIW